MNKYDFNLFLEKTSGLALSEAVKKAEREVDEIDRSTRKVAGAPQARKNGAYEYMEKLKAFLFYLQTGDRAFGAKDEDFKKYNGQFR